MLSCLVARPLWLNAASLKQEENHIWAVPTCRVSRLSLPCSDISHITPLPTEFGFLGTSGSGQ